MKVATEIALLPGEWASRGGGHRGHLITEELTEPGHRPRVGFACGLRGWPVVIDMAHPLAPCEGCMATEVTERAPRRR